MVSLTGCVTPYIFQLSLYLTCERPRSTYLAVTCRKCGTAVGRRYVRVPDELQLMAMGFTLSADLLQRQVPRCKTACFSAPCLSCCRTQATWGKGLQLVALVAQGALVSCRPIPSAHTLQPFDTG